MRNLGPSGVVSTARACLRGICACAFRPKIINVRRLGVVVWLRDAAIAAPGRHSSPPGLASRLALASPQRRRRLWRNRPLWRGATRRPCATAVKVRRMPNCFKRIRNRNRLAVPLPCVSRNSISSVCNNLSEHAGMRPTWSFFIAIISRDVNARVIFSLARNRGTLWLVFALHSSSLGGILMYGKLRRTLRRY